MKHSPFLIILLTLLCLCWDTAQAREHEWTNSRGQTIKAEFIFMKGDNVTISMKGIGNNKDETEYVRPVK